jgi:hypothetical protein
MFDVLAVFSSIPGESHLVPDEASRKPGKAI